MEVCGSLGSGALLLELLLKSCSSSSGQHHQETQKSGVMGPSALFFCSSTLSKRGWLFGETVHVCFAPLHICHSVVFGENLKKK